MALFRFHPPEERRDLLFVAEVGAHGDSVSTARGDFRSCVFDGAWSIIGGLRPAPGRAGCYVHGRAGFSQCEGDATAGTAAGAGGDGDLSCERLHDRTLSFYS